MDDSQNKGSYGYENWKAKLAGASPNGMFEVFLYSDARITGQLSNIEDCPYSFLNMSASHGIRYFAPVIGLRVQNYLDSYDHPPMDKTDVSRYHGTDFRDEMAALASLVMGIRLRAGGITRNFYTDDPLGIPEADKEVPVPLLGPTNNLFRVRHATSTHNLNNSLLPIFPTYPLLKPDHAVVLVRAARLYRDALWIVESEPQIAWLFFVAALEAVAVSVHTATVDSSEVLRRSNKELSELLLERGGEELLKEVANRLHRMLRATGRFIDFVLQYLPDPLEQRPHENLQVSWESDSMKDALRKIYDHRSRALHDGTPFPPLMSEIEPHRAEKPMCLAASKDGGTWTQEDMPMLIHVFEHITRGALLNWWRDTANMETQ